jgi:heparin/heparan-sulfate lyase
LRRATTFPGTELVGGGFLFAFLLAAALLFSVKSNSAAVSNPADLKWEQAEGVSIPIPPAEHPRLYLRERDIPDLRRRTTHPVFKSAWEKLQDLGKTDPARAVEADALCYLLSRDVELGKRAVATALEVMVKSNFPRSGSGTRPTGRIMVTGAIVYDWCYSVMTAEQKKAYLEQFLRLAHNLECGYPPPKTGVVTGHYSEWMLMRDLLSTSIAVYDEYPEMYRFAASRFFSLFVPVRNW